MSIATLKRKTAAKYNNNSVNQKHFSLNGGYRNQGWVGQSNLSRSLPQTYMRGDTLRGYGGCCGQYKITPQITSDIQSTNNNKIMKSSVLSNDGMLATQYRWATRPQPFTSVKPDNNHNLNDQGDYIDLKQRKTIYCADLKQFCTNLEPPITTPPVPLPCGSCNVTPLMFKNVSNSAQSFSEPYPNPITKSIYQLPVATSESEYLTQLTSQRSLIEVDIAFQTQNNKTSNNGTPFACGSAK